MENIKRIDDNTVEIDGVIYEAKKEKDRTMLENGEDYYFLDDTLNIYSAIWSTAIVDFKRHAIGNVFRTKEEAQFMKDRLYIIGRLKKYAEPRDAAWEPNTRHYYLCWNNRLPSIIIDSACLIKSGAIYFPTREAAECAINEIGQDKIKRYYLEVGDNG